MEEAAKDPGGSNFSFVPGRRPALQIWSRVMLGIEVIILEFIFFFLFF